MNFHAAAWCVLLALSTRSSPPSEACGLPTGLGNGTQPVLPATVDPLASDSAKMYGQFSANGVWPAVHADCTLGSSQVLVAVGEMRALWIASYIIVSTATFCGVSRLLRFAFVSWPPKLWNAVTAPSYLSPSKARPILSEGVRFMA